MIKFSYAVDKAFVEDIFDSALKSAHYVVENEQTDTYPMGNRLMGHIEQVLLPGQFFCYGGKYYQVRNISPENGIIVRRAADHLTGRMYYRQLRSYSMMVREQVNDARNLRGMRLQSCYADIEVRTDGYLEMKARNCLPDASIVRLDDIRSRTIPHKEILRVQMPEASPEVRFTICVLLNELFQTIYPNETGYVIASMDGAPEQVLVSEDYTDRIRALVPLLTTADNAADSIYFVEDSNIDLGLLVSIERNFQRFMEILTDYLDWYLDPARNADGETPGDAEDDETATDVNEAKAAPEGGVQRDRIHADAIAATDVDGEDEELLGGGFGSLDGQQAWMKKVEYLTYGYANAPDWLALSDTLKFLSEHQFLDSNLHRSRKLPPDFDEGSTYDPNQPGTHYCDFCGCVLEKGKYDVLKDGRERCPECSADAVKTRKQFKKIYVDTLKEMEQIFGIKIDVPVKVRMANAKKVNDIPGSSFEPTPHADGRVLGYAQKSGSNYKLLVESGAPKWKMKSTLVHELSHIWQYCNWTDAQVSKAYPSTEASQTAYEGMAVWAEIQYLLSMGEKERAIMYKRNREADPSVYGVGMKRYLARYPIQNTATVNKKKSPFGRFPPI